LVIPYLERGLQCTCYRVANEFKAGPLLSSSATTSYVVSGLWSLTRPGVFYISKSDGSIEIWDLMDQSHSPSSIQSVSSRAISYMEIHQSPVSAKSRSFQQFIAAGDDEGTLHILEAPRTLTRALKNEKASVKTFFEREVRRIGYVRERKELRAVEKANFDLQIGVALAQATAQAAAHEKTVAANAAAAAQKKENGGKKEEAAVAAVPSPVDEEAEKLEQEFIRMEKEFLELEGLIPQEV
jgi:hypothetical protein